MLIDLKRVTVLIFSSFLMTFSALSQSEPSAFERIRSGMLVEELEGRQLGAARQSIQARPVLQLALDMIKLFEGWSSTAYNDPAGYCTIGYGHLISKARCETISLGRFSDAMTKEMGNELLADDTRSSRITIQQLVLVELNPRQFGALTSFVFNVGSVNFGKSTLLRLLNQGEYELAGRELRKWTKAKGEILPGLVVRRNCELSLFNGEPISRTANGRIDLDACGKSVGAAVDIDQTIDIDSGEPR